MYPWHDDNRSNTSQEVGNVGKLSMSNRGKEWIDFSRQVFAHIEDYTVPQYGDSPQDQASGFGVDDIRVNMARYVIRIGRNARGPEESRRDCLKLAHYACLLALKLGEENP